MRQILPILTAFVFAAFAAPSANYADESDNDLQLIYSSSLEDERQECESRLAHLEYRRALARYTAGGCPIRPVIRASLKQLQKDIASGPGRHASAYDARIADLQQRVQFLVKQGVSTQNELDQVLNARLDVMVSKIILDPIE